MIWFFQLHDTIKMKSNHTGIYHDNNNTAIRSHIMIYNSIIIFATKFSSIYLAKGQKLFFFQLSFVNLQRTKDGTHIWCKIYTCVCCISLIKSHGWYQTSLITSPSECLPCNKKNATKFGSKNEILQILLYHQVASYVYLIVNLCIISSSLNYIIKLKQFHNIATKVSSRKKLLLLLVIALTDVPSMAGLSKTAVEVKVLMDE